MTNTTYYNLNIVEGTDIVNPLIVDNPNYQKIDEVMHDNAVSGVTLATEIANATVHAITRENSECSVIRFIATSVWRSGDTVTVDGVPVTALLPSGETLPDGAYVINANVLCILTGTNLTVYAERKKINDASDIAYNGTNVEEALNVIGTRIFGEINSVEVPPNTVTKIGSITLPKGVWIVTWNGYNPTELYDGGKYAMVEIEGIASVQSKDWIQNSISAVRLVDSNTTFNLNCSHTAASTIKTNKTSSLIATRIK